MRFILGKKIEMTQVWKGDEILAVTKVKAGPCFVAQVKAGGKDGYGALQLGFEEKKEKNIKKPQRGHLKGLKNFRFLKEFRVSEEEAKKAERGDLVTAATFEEGDRIRIVGFSKGRGFQGVVKRHGFAGSKATHGNKDQLRMPGSVGATAPQRVFKGVRMGGRMGGGRVTVANLEIIGIDKEDNSLLIKGAVPGARNGLLMIVGDGELKLEKPGAKTETPAPAENAEQSKEELIEEKAEVEEVKSEADNKEAKEAEKA